ncbi:MAG: zinc ribbon domain-containing protein [Candidatus Bathyarchaeota archaeon]
MEDKASGEEESRLAPRRCPRCKEMNPSGSKYCSRCSLPLDMETVELEQEVRGEVDRGMDLLFSDPEFRDYVARKLMELKPA